MARQLPLIYFVRSRWTGRTSLLLILLAAVAYVLQDRDIGVPFVPGDTVVRSSPLLPILPVIPLVTVSATAMSALEAAAASSRLVVARAIWGVTLSVLAALLAGVAAIGAVEGATVLVAARNALALIGTGLIGAVLLGADLAWLPVCLLVLCTFFFGQNFDNETRSWAWLLQPAAAEVPLAISFGLLAVGVAGFAFLDSGGWLRRKVTAG